MPIYLTPFRKRWFLIFEPPIHLDVETIIVTLICLYSSNNRSIFYDYQRNIKKINFFLLTNDFDYVDSKLV